MVNADRVCGVVASLLAAGVIAGTYKLSFFRAGVPGPGMLPFFVSLFIGACGVMLMVAPAGDRKKVAWPPTPIRRKIAFSYLVLVLYFALTPILGFLLMTSVFLAGLAWWWGDKGGWAPLVFGGIGGPLMFFIFRVLLDVPLHLGIWAQ